MSNVIPFKFDQQPVRVVQGEDGEPWVVLADVCSVLEIGNASMAASRLDEDEITLSTVEGSHRPTNLINEAGLYSLILTSRKPEAKRFKRWVTHEVLPAIRKTGGYQAQDPMQVLADPAAMRGLLLTYTEKVLALESEIEQQAPKVAAHQRIANTEGAVCLREAAKTLQVSPSFLIDYLLERRWLYRVGTRGRLQAFQPRLDRGYLRHKANRDGHLPQVLVTMKGLARIGELIAQEESRGQVIHARFGAYQRQEELL